MSTDDLPLASTGGCGDGCACGAEGDEEYLESGLDPALAELLAAAGLDPVEVEDIANVAIQEDLAAWRGRDDRLHHPRGRRRHR